MHFESDHLYHIYNQGNNKQNVFFTRDNYLFFLDKINKHLKPYCHVLAWCLMPNHFHLMVKIKSSLNCHDPQNSIHPVSKAIAIILRSYTHAINKQENRSGSLFRGGTKAQCITCCDSIEKSWWKINGIIEINADAPEDQYPQICYQYILNNPLEARLVKHAKDWEFSSVRDVLGLRDGSLIDRDVIEEYGLVI